MPLCELPGFLGYLIVGCIAVLLSFWIGRIDGYWSRAAEERASSTRGEVL